MDYREILCGGVDWIDLANDRYQWKALVYTVTNLRVAGYVTSSWMLSKKGSAP
jgi:hypothetical protein